MEYGDSRAVLVKKKVFTKIEMENGISSTGFTGDVLERNKEEKRAKMFSESDIQTD